MTVWGLQAGRAAPAGRAASLDRLTAFGLVAAIAVLFGVSGGMLWLLGYNYDGLTGSPATKIHPFTYMVVVLFVWRVMASGDPVGVVTRALNRRPAAALMAAAGALTLVVTVLRSGPGMAGFVDTFVGPALMVFLLADADEHTMRRVTVALHVLMIANAVLALGEFVTRQTLFPYRLDGAAVFPTDPRSTALGGHPLVNASITACYVIGLVNGARAMPVAFRLMLIGLQSAALVTFGGRSGLVVTVLLGGGYLIFAAMRSLRGRRVPLLGVATGVLLVTVLPLLVVAASTAGFFDIALGRFESDGGSANARVQMFELFSAIPLRDLIVGPDVSYVESLRRINGLEWGIENPVVRLMLYQGAALALLLIVAFVLFMTEVTRQCEPGAWLTTIGCLVLLNTAESIGAKTTILAKCAVIILCLYQRAPPRPRGRSRRPSLRPTETSASTR